tara:strand:+ start:422 stop:625 length:204 start_codon:yes stop_codon:yes gene_type:complete
MSKGYKLKSVSVSIGTYEKIVEIAKKERRSLKEQVAIIVDDVHAKHGFRKRNVARKNFSGGLSAVED